jgi:putative NIF3 family GTP cyclohydrolase 1 type 2
MRISDAIERILDHMPKRLPAGDCDRVVHGDAQRELHGIAVTFMASHEVLERAAAAGADFIVTHEPTWWNHHDHTDWLAGDPVQGAKAAFIEAHGQVLWRLHDHVHIGWPDMIAQGMLQALGWEAQVSERVGIVALPAQPLRAVANHVRQRLGAAAVRVAGDLDAAISRIAFLPGACGGRRQLDLLRLPDVDAVFCGESAEWETCEYVRDAVTQGRPKGLIVTGHANSEEAGMAYVAEQIRAWFPEVPVAYLPTGDPFRVIV